MKKEKNIKKGGIEKKTLCKMVIAGRGGWEEVPCTVPSTHPSRNSVVPSQYLSTAGPLSPSVEEERCSTETVHQMLSLCSWVK